MFDGNANCFCKKKDMKFSYLDSNRFNRISINSKYNLTNTLIYKCYKRLEIEHKIERQLI